MATALGLTARAKIVGNPNAHTQYITIPSVLAQDSAYPFKEGEEVQLEIVTARVEAEKGSLLVRPTKPSATKSK